ncbi:MAG: protein-ER retention protein [Peltula sp. TS41687]|nr:MAG: protein-ER retention protein [Peltula sp. TS41687]
MLCMIQIWSQKYLGTYEYISMAYERQVWIPNHGTFIKTKTILQRRRGRQKKTTKKENEVIKPSETGFEPVRPKSYDKCWHRSQFKSYPLTTLAFRHKRDPEIPIKKYTKHQLLDPLNGDRSQCVLLIWSKADFDVCQRTSPGEMDGDPAVEPQLDRFSSLLPLPYRVSILLILGVWGWGFNLHYLSFLKIDVPALIRYPHRHSASVPSHHLSTYRFATLLTIPLVTSLFIFWTFTGGQARLVVTHEILPQSYLFFLFLSFLLPLKRLSRAGRYRFLSTLKRISIGGLAETQDGKFGDILLADALTSYAKVLGDLFVSACMFLSPTYSSTGLPNRRCGGDYIVPFVMAIPSLIRLRQCLIEYIRVRKSNEKHGGMGQSGWGGQHLANALKYSSAFPVIILSAMQRGYDTSKIGMSETGLFRLWLLFVFVNSFYSFYWDVTKDWDLHLFSSSSSRNNPAHPYGLRRHRYFHTAQLYYIAIVIDFLLRCTWSFKLSPHLDHLNDLEGGIFVMEFLEVFRRWIWIFFRVETEWVRNNLGPAPDDILLGEYNGKIDDD